MESETGCSFSEIPSIFSLCLAIEPLPLTVGAVEPLTVTARFPLMTGDVAESLPPTTGAPLVGNGAEPLPLTVGVVEPLPLTADTPLPTTVELLPLRAGTV